MSLTEKYVSSLAAGSGDGSIGSPWTLTEAFANAVAGQRVNIKADGTYTRSANDTPTNSGTSASPIIYRGYKTTIGDGYLGRTNGNGALMTTNMPLIAYNSGFKLNANANTNIIFESLNLSGFVSAALLDAGTTRSVIKDCVSVNDSISNSASAVFAQLIYNCDFSTNSGGGACNANVYFRIIGCRISAPNGSCVQLANGVVGVAMLFNVFYNAVNAIKITGTSASAPVSLLAMNNTAYALTGDFLQLPNAASPAGLHFPILINNHITDCSSSANNLYAGTSDVPIFRANNRTRDNTNADTGFGDWPRYNPITTDTGGPETDYVDAAGGDFRLIGSAPGKAAGIPAYTDCGALQRQESGGAPRIIGPCYLDF